MLRLVTLRISRPFPGLSPLGFRPRHCCLPHSPICSPWTWPSGYESHAHTDLPSHLWSKTLQSIVQRRTDANRGLTMLNAKQPLQETQWCYPKFTSCKETSTMALNRTMQSFVTNDHMQKEAQETQHATQKLL